MPVDGPTDYIFIGIMLAVIVGVLVFIVRG